MHQVLFFSFPFFISIFFKLENHINPSLNALFLQVLTIFVTGRTMSSPAFQFMWPNVILRFNLQLCLSFISLKITLILIVLFIKVNSSGDEK